MRTLRLFAFVSLSLLLAGCAAVPTGDQRAKGTPAESERPAAESAEQPAAWQAAWDLDEQSLQSAGALEAAGKEPAWQYPMAAGMWYPGDGPLPAQPFRYYRVRCWPGCHDPNSAPRPHSY